MTTERVMTPERRALLDALTVERFTHLPENTPADPNGLTHRQTLTAALPTHTQCAGCGQRVIADEPCPTCRAYRQAQARRARLRVV